MKTLKLALLATMFIFSLQNGFTQSRLGYTFDEIDKEFEVNGYTVLHKQFGKNVGYGYHFYIKFDDGNFCHYLNNDLICERGLFIPNDDSTFEFYVKIYNEYKNTEINDLTWIVHDVENNSYFKIQAFTSKPNPSNFDKKYFEYTIIYK